MSEKPSFECRGCRKPCFLQVGFDDRDNRVDPEHCPFRVLGADESKFVSFGQGYLSMSPPMKELEKLVLEGAIVHNDNPVLKWMASNVAVLQDPAGNVKTNKDKSSEKIDGIVAAIMAVGLMTVDPGADISIYETEGLRMLG